MTDIDPRVVRQLATEHILEDARRAHDVGAAVLGHFGPEALTKHEYGAYCTAIREAIKTATLVVGWPDDHRPQTAADAAERVQAFLDARAACGAHRFQELIAAEQNRHRLDAPLLELTEPDLRALLADRARMATELEQVRGERDEDTRIVHAAIDSRHNSGRRLLQRVHQINAVYERFADRFAALGLRDGSEGDPV